MTLHLKPALADSLVKFDKIVGNLHRDNVLTLTGSSILAETFTVTITKSWMRPSPPPRFSWNEGCYYLQHKNKYYLINITFGEDQSQNKVDGGMLHYSKYGIPPHVYTSIVGSLVTAI